MRLGLLLTVTSGAALAMAASAGATASTASFDGTAAVEAGPRIAGARLIWAGEPRIEDEVTSATGTTRAYAVTPGRPGTRQLSGQIATANDYVPYFDADTEYYAFTSGELPDPRADGDSGAHGEVPYLGSLRVRYPEALTSCHSDGQLTAASVALDGGRLLWSGCLAPPNLYSDDLGPVYLDDLRVGRRTQLTTRGTDVRLAGNYAAWRTPDDLVVFDLQANRELYRLTSTELPLDFRDYDLQEDGKLAIISGATGASRGEVLWTDGTKAVRSFALAQPAARVRFRDNHIVALTPGPRITSLSSLRLIELDGSQRVLARFRDVARQWPADFDFDGRKVAWASKECQRIVLHLRSLDEPQVDADQATSCPLVVLTRSTYLDTDRGMEIVVMCPKGPRTRGPASCTGTMTFRTLGGRLIAKRRFDISASIYSDQTPLRLRLPKGPWRHIELVADSTMAGHRHTTTRIVRIL